MSVQSEYKQKLVSPETAVRAVKSGDWVDYNFCLAQPVVLDEALAGRVDELADVTIRGGMRMTPMRVLEADPEGRVFSYASWHLTALERGLCDAGRCTHIPMVYRNNPLFYRKSLDVDVAMFSVPPMDDEGNFSFSLTNSASRAIVDRAGVLILEVNENLPTIKHGYEHTVHISEATFVVESGNPEPPVLDPVPVTPVDRKIAALILDRIRDGATVQFGIGALPNAIGAMIVESDLKNLGVHTEMLVDSNMLMDKAGKITNTHKGVDRGRSVFSFCVGSRALYDWTRNNDALATGPVNYTNDPVIIARNPDMVSVNSCVEVDILGQVSSETSGKRQISGTGGQMDFMTGAYLSPGGQSFICCHSTFTDKQGKVHSRIRLSLPEFSVVTDPRALVHCVVTEWGIADLAGRSIWERAERLINIAHPDFREELFLGAEKLGFRKRSARK